MRKQTRSLGPLVLLCIAAAGGPPGRGPTSGPGTPATAAAAVPPAVTLFHSGERTLSPADRATAAAWAVSFLETAALNTDTHAAVLRQSVPDVQNRYRRTVRGDYLVVAFAEPAAVKTAGGDVTVREIVVGLNRPDEVPSALFTVDPAGRVVAHEKYRGSLPDLLQPKAAMTESAIGETRFRIGLYLAANGHLPPDLAALPNRPGYRNQTTDAWGRPLGYSTAGNDGFTLASLGRDGVVGGRDDDADIERRFRVSGGSVQPQP